jgi:hypothetical protein
MSTKLSDRRVITLVCSGGLATLATFAVCIGPWFVPAGPGINRQCFQKLHKGMTEEQVEQILGVRAGRYVDGEVEAVGRPEVVRYEKNDAPLPEWKMWVAERAEIGVAFDRKGGLCGKWICRMRRSRGATL